MNHDRAGTIHFMALEMNNEPGEQIPRLYRHDPESFVWVLVYITVVNVEYDEGRPVKTSRPLVHGGGYAHLSDSSRRLVLFDHGYRLPVAEPHKHYLAVVENLVDYLVLLYNDSPRQGSTGSMKLEDYNPKDRLECLIGYVEKKGGWEWEPKWRSPRSGPSIGSNRNPKGHVRKFQTGSLALYGYRVPL